MTVGSRARGKGKPQALWPTIALLHHLLVKLALGQKDWLNLAFSWDRSVLITNPVSSEVDGQPTFHAISHLGMSSAPPPRMI